MSRFKFNYNSFILSIYTISVYL